MACLHGRPSRAAHKAFKKRLRIGEWKPGYWTAQGWPQRRQARTPKQLAQQKQFAEYAAATKVAWLGDQLQAKAIAMDTGWYPRDVQIRAYAGNLLEWYDRNGQLYQSRRLAPPAPPVPPVENWPVLIEKVTLSADAPSVVFTAIPQTYNDLMLVIAAQSTASANNDELMLQFNGDTGAHYYWSELYGTGTTTGSAHGDAVTSARIGELAAGFAGALLTGTSQVTIARYGAGSVQKSAQASSQYTYGASSDGLITTVNGIRWTGTASIDQITLHATGGNLASGSYFALYGM